METKNKIRINAGYLKTIKLLAIKYFDSNEIRIFGSRADMDKKGGDIDIYIKTKKTENIILAKLAFLRDFEKIHGEQKIDLIINNSKNKQKKIFNIAENEGVEI